MRADSVVSWFISVCSYAFHGVLHWGHFYCIADGYKMTFTPALSGVALAEKAAENSKRRGRQCDHPPAPQNPSCLLSLLAAQAGLCWPCLPSCFPDWLLDCLSLMQALWEEVVDSFLCYHCGAVDNFFPGLFPSTCLRGLACRCYVPDR